MFVNFWKFRMTCDDKKNLRKKYAQKNKEPRLILINAITLLKSLPNAYIITVIRYQWNLNETLSKVF